MFDFLILAAQKSSFDAATGPDGKSLSVVLGDRRFPDDPGPGGDALARRRTSEVKRPKDE